MQLLPIIFEKVVEVASEKTLERLFYLGATLLALSPVLPEIGFGNPPSQQWTPVQAIFEEDQMTFEQVDCLARFSYSTSFELKDDSGCYDSGMLTWNNNILARELEAGFCKLNTFEQSGDRPKNSEAQAPVIRCPLIKVSESNGSVGLDLDGYYMIVPKSGVANHPLRDHWQGLIVRTSIERAFVQQ